jgi:hypothetical protein
MAAGLSLIALITIGRSPRACFALTHTAARLGGWKLSLRQSCNPATPQHRLAPSRLTHPDQDE